MKVKKLPKSKYVEQDISAYRVGKRSLEPYADTIVMGGMKAASTALTDFVKGKRDRENGPDSPMTKLIKAVEKQKNPLKKKR